MFRLYQSNRLENLAAQLTDVFASPLDNPFDAEIVVTQSGGMAHWLAVFIAENASIAANLHFPLPAAFVWQMLIQHLPSAPKKSLYERTVMIWRIAQVLPGKLDSPKFQALKTYLDGNSGLDARYQLALRIADVFDQYSIYRPKMLAEWEHGQGTDWQAELWRELVRQDSGDHRAALFARFRQHCEAKQLDVSKLPQRISLFGVSTLPPMYVDIFRLLAEHVEVNFFVFNPCADYWGDIKDEKFQARMRAARSADSSGDRYYRAGNDLLASMGGQGRDFLELLLSFEGFEEIDLFDQREPVSLLESIQTDVLNLRNRHPDDGPGASHLAEDDSSVRIHICHSPAREVQILRDQLLRMFAASPDLTPRDVVVMAPEIETYAPYIDAVFTSAGGGFDKGADTAIPYTIADRSVAHEHPLLQAFLDLLALPKSRLTASEVLALLDVPALLERFELCPEDIGLLSHWIHESGIRWGLDGPDRARFDLPEFDQNSWRFGLDRMLLGYALAPQRELFDGVLPYPSIEGTDAEKLGYLCQLIDTLAHYRQRLAEEYTVSEWQSVIYELLEAFFAVDDDEHDLIQLVRTRTQELVENIELAGFNEAISVDTIEDYFRHQFADSGLRQRFFTGGITFCSLLPMRSIPFKIVCLLGMNDVDYPRRGQRIGFDKMRDSHQLGDRSRRDDDRYLFLEALLSARRNLYISYVGRSLHDNSEQQPSVLVSELLDYIERGFGGDTGSADIRERLVTVHPLQPFSPRYFFGGENLISHSSQWLKTAKSLSERTPQAPFIEVPIALPEDDGVIELASLIEFFCHPCRYFLRHRLGINMDIESRVLGDSESFALDPLEAYRLRQHWLEQSIQGIDADTEQACLLAEGLLPAAEFGRLQLTAAEDETVGLMDSLAEYLVDPREPTDIELLIGTTILKARLDGIFRDGIVRWHAAKSGALDMLRLWLRHLVLNARPIEGVGLRSTHVGFDKMMSFAPLDDASQRLEDLMSLYHIGQRAPLPFYPKTSFRYARARQENKPIAIAACTEWSGNEYRGIPGDADDPYTRCAMRGQTMLATEFEETAWQIFAPLLTAVDEIKRQPGTMRDI